MPISEVHSGLPNNAHIVQLILANDPSGGELLYRQYAQQFELNGRACLMKDGLRRLKPKEREVLTRFYLQEQTPEAICAAMGLTGTQFRLLKCRSKQLLERSVAQAMYRPIPEKRLALSLACSNAG